MSTKQGRHKNSGAVGGATEFLDVKGRFVTRDRAEEMTRSLNYIIDLLNNHSDRLNAKEQEILVRMASQGALTKKQHIFIHGLRKKMEAHTDG